MTKEKSKPDSLNSVKFVFLGLYFLILTTERVISLVSCCIGDFGSYDPLDYYMMALTVLAIFGAYVIAVIKCTDALKHQDDENYAPKGNIFANLSIAAGVLLLGGMVHTHGSIPVMQFISYGMILISMAIHTAQNVKLYKGADKKWLSFAYTVAYSMAIPVVYHTNIQLAYLFIPIEAVVSAGMVILFTIMLYRFFNGTGESNFSLMPFMVALFGDFAVLALRWSEEVNTFVLIFLCVTSVLWFAGNILCLKKK